MNTGKVYLVPALLYEDAVETIPVYITEAVKDCQVFFVENERSARRYLKKIWKEITIDDYQWFVMHKAEHEVVQQFVKILQSGKNIGIISEAGCPGVADPGQVLVEAAQKLNAVIRPLVGPSSILLALMASGMNGQCFQFHGYLPIESAERKKILRELEADSAKRNCTQLFIETPYRNNQLLGDILQACRETTRVCVAVDITSPAEMIKTKTVKEWKLRVPDIHKKLSIFLLHA